MLPFLFLFAFMPFVLFVRVKSFRKKIKRFENALMTSSTLLLKKAFSKNFRITLYHWLVLIIHDENFWLLNILIDFDIDY